MFQLQKLHLGNAVRAACSDRHYRPLLFSPLRLLSLRKAVTLYQWGWGHFHHTVFSAASPQSTIHPQAAASAPHIDISSLLPDCRSLPATTSCRCRMIPTSRVSLPDHEIIGGDLRPGTECWVDEALGVLVWCVRVSFCTRTVGLVHTGRTE